MDLTNIPIVIIFAVSLIGCVASSFVRTLYIRTRLLRPGDIFLFNGVSSLVVALVLFAVNGFRFEASGFSVWFGVLFGTVTMVQAILFAFAIHVGPWSYSTVILNMSTVVTALSGFLFWHEKISVTQLIGIAFMVVCFFFSVKKEEDAEKKKGNLLWLLLCVLAMLMGAGVGLMQKTHQSSEHAGELMEFLIVAFLASFVFSTAVWFYRRSKEEKSEMTVSVKKYCVSVSVMLLLFGIGVALNNWLNLYLSGMVDTAIFFPVVNGIPLMANILLALIVFREKLSRRQWFGIGAGLIALTLLCLPF